MTACYLDSSALVKLLTPEAETTVLRDHLTQYSGHVTNRLAEVEVIRALLRRGEESAVLADALSEALPNLSILELDAQLSEHAGRILPATLRSLDAIHLASALALAPDLGAVVTYDNRLADAARAAGLNVVAPA